VQHPGLHPPASAAVGEGVAAAAVTAATVASSALRRRSVSRLMAASMLLLHDTSTSWTTCEGASHRTIRVLRPPGLRAGPSGSPARACAATQSPAVPHPLIHAREQQLQRSSDVRGLMNLLVSAAAPPGWRRLVLAESRPLGVRRQHLAVAQPLAPGSRRRDGGHRHVARLPAAALKRALRRRAKVRTNPSAFVLTIQIVNVSCSSVSTLRRTAGLRHTCLRSRSEPWPRLCVYHDAGSAPTHAMHRACSKRTSVCAPVCCLRASSASRTYPNAGGPRDGRSSALAFAIVHGSQAACQ
jgi:hypothetical protein